MDLTEDILRGAYAYLAETPPFRDWNLPDAEDVKFKVTYLQKAHGECHTIVYGDGRCEFAIDISGTTHKHSNSLLATMAHEMIHVHQRQNYINRTKRSHDAAFWAYAKEVCDAHGFDLGQF